EVDIFNSGRNIKTSPIITHTELNTLDIKNHFYNQQPCVRMSYCIVNGLLPNAQQIVFDRCRQWSKYTTNLYLRFYWTICCQATSSISQRTRKIRLVERL